MNEQMQQQIVALVQAAMQGDQQAQQQIQQITQAAQQGDQQAMQIAQMIQSVMQKMQGGTRVAKLGAKLNYIKFLKGQCPEGFEMQQFKKGGAICNKCVAKKAAEGTQITTSFDPVAEFKCGRKMKKKACGGSMVKKSACGSKVKADKCGSKVESSKCGTKIESSKCGKKLKKKEDGGNIDLNKLRLLIEKCGGKTKKNCK